MSGDKGVGGFAALEDYDGYEFIFENGYYARVAFKRDEVRGAPHPYKYSLTLHAQRRKAPWIRQRASRRAPQRKIQKAKRWLRSLAPRRKRQGAAV